MSAEQYEHVGELYHAALELAPEQRADFLAEACGDQAELRREVDSLLRARAQADGFIAGRVAGVLAEMAEPQPASLVGSSLSHYQVLSLLGAGGMGEVYLAQDTRLQRKVAIKLLPRAFTHNAERLRRFKQEALATSALNHPNILTVYDIGEAPPELGGAPFIVAELLEGAELRRHLKEGPLHVRKVIEYARQIAAGLTAAHDKGIVHRDLKPENLFVTNDGLVKILDFGLAKLRPQDHAQAAADKIPSAHLTNPGTVMGTAGYMSPEQVRGQETDHRADIFSFGLILYEMLAGRHPFQGESSAETMAAIVKEEPAALTEANPKVPPQLEQIVMHCLEKQPARRFQTVSDLGFELDALLTPSGARLKGDLLSSAPKTVVAAPPRLKRKQGGTVAIALGVLLASVFTGIYFLRSSAPAAHPLKLALALQDKTRFIHLALSPDGKWLAYNVDQGNLLPLWALSLVTGETKLLVAGEGGRHPFWSPDSRFIGFFAADKLKKVALSGGPPVTICDFPRGDGGTWNREDVIVISGWGDQGLSRVSATGGVVTPLLPPEMQRADVVFRYPYFLPDGRHFICTASSDDKESSGIYLGALNGGKPQRLLSDASNAVYAADGSGAGYLLFGREGALLAQPFDAQKLRLTGQPIPVAGQVSTFATTSLHRFSASENGLLIFDPLQNRLQMHGYWVDRSGKRISSLKPLHDVNLARLAPDGQRVVFSRYNMPAGGSDLWVSEVRSGTDVRLTFNPSKDYVAIWAPDANRFVWATKRGEHYQLYEKSVDQTKQELPLLESKVSKYPTDWSPDGRYIIYFQVMPQTKSDLWALPLFGERKPFPLLQTPASEGGGVLSPDGQWLAYYSNESGRHEVYIQRFIGGGGKRRVSINGGVAPQWRGDGKELYYHSLDGKLMVVPVMGGTNLAVGAPVAIVEFPYRGVAEQPYYSVDREGRRFLLTATVETETNSPLTVLVNWIAGVKQ